jgi:hypothetical protein
MTYNVLGEDFKKKDDAYKYFRKKINEFDTRSHIVMTKETPVRQSDMKQLEKDYGSISDRATAKKSSYSDYQFPPEELDVDHVYPFAKIKKEFLELYGKEFIMKCVYKGGAVHRLDNWSPDDEVYPDSPKEAWFDFHKERATYQMLCTKGKNGFPGCHPLKRMGRKIEFKAFSGI